VKVQIPVGKLIAFASHAAGKARGGLTPAEARELCGELLSVVALPLVGLAPPVVGSVLAPVLEVVADLLQSPPATVEEAASRVVAAVAPFVPASVDLDIPDTTVEIVG